MILVHISSWNNRFFFFFFKENPEQNPRQNLLSSEGYLRQLFGFILFIISVLGYNHCKIGYIKHIIRYSLFVVLFSSSFFHSCLLSCSWKFCLTTTKKCGEGRRRGHRALECKLIWHQSPYEEKVTDHMKFFILFVLLPLGVRDDGQAGPLLGRAGQGRREVREYGGAAHIGESWPFVLLIFQ